MNVDEDQHKVLIFRLLISKTLQSIDRERKYLERTQCKIFWDLSQIADSISTRMAYIYNVGATIGGCSDRSPKTAIQRWRITVALESAERTLIPNPKKA